jgi:ABC-type transport system substrate-binding protein
MTQMDLQSHMRALTKSFAAVPLVCAMLLLWPSTLFISSLAVESGTASSTSATSCPASNTFDWTLVRPPASLNPLTFITGTGYIFELEYPGATWYLWNGSDVSYMLSGWTHNANYTMWTLNIKPGLTWSNGEPVTSEDLLTSEGPKYAFNLTYNYLNIAQELSDEYAVNSSAVTFVLNQTNTHFIDELSLDGQGGTPVLPSSVIDDYGPSYPNLGTDLSMGPFYVYNYPVSSAQMIMLRNPYFSPQPSICQVDVSFVETLSLTANRLEAGQTDLAPLNPFDVSYVLKNPDLHVLDEKAVGAASLEYNDSIYPYNQLPFRQALVYGINQSAFVQEAYDGYGETGYSAESAVPSSAGLWYNPNTVQYNYNPAKASSLLASIGITKGADGYLHYPNGTTASLTLWTDVDNTEDTSGASVVEQDLQSLGFQVSLQTTTAANIAANYGANVNGIRNELILFSGFVLNPANPLVDALPACDVEWLPAVCGHNFLWPPSVDAEYQSNFTAFMSTTNVTLERQDLFNIQHLESEYLPTTILAYPDYIWGYSTAHWTNWPTGHMDEGLPEVPNLTAWETLTPVTQSGPARGSNSFGMFGYLAIVAVLVAATAGVLFVRRTRAS